MAPNEEISRLIVEHRQGKEGALDRLMPYVYKELKKLAAHQLKVERPNHTLQATALVNEAYLRLARQADADWQDRAHFFAIAATVMRHILIDYARARSTDKRAGIQVQVPIEEAIEVAAGQNTDLLAL